MSAPSAAVNSVHPLRGGSVGRFAEYQPGILRVRSDEAIPAGGVKFLRDSAIILDQPLGVVPAFLGDAMAHGTNRVPRCILSIRFITGATGQINDEIACRLARRDAVANSILCGLGVSVVQSGTVMVIERSPTTERTEHTERGTIRIQTDHASTRCI